VDVAGNAMPYTKDKLLLFHGVTDGRILAMSQSLPETSSFLKREPYYLTVSFREQRE
jgi:hypothetical protein